MGHATAFVFIVSRNLFFKSFKLHLLVVTEIGQRDFELARQSDWITATEPTFHNGEVSMMKSRRLDRYVRSESRQRNLGIVLGTPDGNRLLVRAYTPQEG